MQPVAHDGMTHIEPVKNHAQGDRISGMLQIHLEHIWEETCLILTDDTETLGNTRQSPDIVRFFRVDDARIP